MKRNLYAIRDNKIGEFNAPCIFQNHNAALRAFGDMVTSDSKSLVALHPEDFSLFFLGEMNMETGAFVQSVAPVSLALGTDFIKGE